MVPLPDEAGRADILRVHMRGVPLADHPDSTAATLAKATAGEGAGGGRAGGSWGVLLCCKGCQGAAGPFFVAVSGGSWEWRTACLEVA